RLVEEAPRHGLLADEPAVEERTEDQVRRDERRDAATEHATALTILDDRRGRRPTWREESLNERVAQLGVAIGLAEQRHQDPATQALGRHGHPMQLAL